ncbi:MAG: DUF1203 domain-containing protein [Pseudomonadota bacterium]
MHAFQIVGIDPGPFERLFNLTDEQLAALGAVRRIATESPGFPCRVSLEDAEVGDELLLLPYEHHTVPSPYRSAGPIFVRRDVTQQRMPAGHIPPYVTRRLISVRAYDAQGMMVDAAVCEGPAVKAEIDRCFDDSRVAYLQLHNAKCGCFSCQVNRC